VTAGLVDSGQAILVEVFPYGGAASVWVPVRSS
jgi:hypothetical protein